MHKVFRSRSIGWLCLSTFFGIRRLSSAHHCGGVQREDDHRWREIWRTLANLTGETLPPSPILRWERESVMNAETPTSLPKVALLLITLVTVFSLNAAQRHTLIVNGSSTDIPVIYVNSQPYVGLEALAKVLQGWIDSSGPIVALSLPTNSTVQAASSTSPSEAHAPASAATCSLQSRFFSRLLERWHRADVHDSGMAHRTPDRH